MNKVLTPEQIILLKEIILAKNKTIQALQMENKLLKLSIKKQKNIQ